LSNYFLIILKKNILLYLLLVGIGLSCNPVKKSDNKIDASNDYISVNDTSHTSFEKIAEDNHCDCDVKVYLTDPDTTGTNVRENPNGKVIRTIHYENDCLCLRVDIKAAKNDWIQLNEGGWVYAPLFSIASRNYRKDESVFLNAFPTEESDVMAEFKTEQEFTVLSCNGTWLYVKSKNNKKGWLKYDMQCANPVTTCP
jgi:SH3-like domain-containing protein